MIVEFTKLYMILLNLGTRIADTDISTRCMLDRTSNSYIAPECCIIIFEIDNKWPLTIVLSPWFTIITWSSEEVEGISICVDHCRSIISISHIESRISVLYCYISAINCQLLTWTICTNSQIPRYDRTSTRRSDSTISDRETSISSEYIFYPDLLIIVWSDPGSICHVPSTDRKSVV